MRERYGWQSFAVDGCLFALKINDFAGKMENKNNEFAEKIENKINDFAVKGTKESKRIWIKGYMRRAFNAKEDFSLINSEGDSSIKLAQNPRNSEYKIGTI